ncbi:nuclear transport factor 2 family protein [Nodosilinea sp. LEGE 07298]|uniref:YybH family protein n=1 Tax=Nodosilinea sp. LEGE 07298 TaxID=2777970 RepID=UPI00187F40F4|nr:nuclear transport factor 2 family protein [Nodosilinea sp. LEGE 07298]MBE9109061.1 nuclear transport factor 2 family protein [Nodosilinea sp. LEGE 07298]
MTATTIDTKAEAQILHLIEAHAQAICDKNLDQIMAHYAPEIVIFDMKPPLTLNGIAACRQMWETSMPYMPTISGMDQQELSITISGDLALAHWVSRFVGIAPDHPAAQMCLRITAACQRHQDEWQIIHEHISVPFASESGEDCDRA